MMKFILIKNKLFKFLLCRSFFVSNFNFDFDVFSFERVFSFFIFIVKEFFLLNVFVVYFSINFFSYFIVKNLDNKVFPFFAKLFYFVDIFSFFFFNLFVFHVFAIVFNYFLSVNLKFHYEIKLFLSTFLNFKKYLYIYSRRPFVEKSICSVIGYFLLDLFGNKFIFMDEFFFKYFFFKDIKFKVNFLYSYLNFRMFSFNYRFDMSDFFVV